MVGGFGKWEDANDEIQQILDNHKEDVKSHLNKDVDSL